MAITFILTDEDAPGPGSFVWDDLGFGPVDGTIRIDEDLIGLGLPLVDIGFYLDFVVGARLVLDVGYGRPKIDIKYRMSEGEFVGQTAISEFNPESQAAIALKPHYKDDPISFSTAGMQFLLSGQDLVVDAPDPSATYLHVYIDYTLKLTARDPFVGIDLVFDDYSYSPGGSFTLLNIEHGVIDIIPKTYAGETIAELDSGVFAGSFIKVPIPPDYNPDPAVVVDDSENQKLPTLRVTDQGDPFANLNFNISQFITEKTAIPLAAEFVAGDFRALVELLRAQAHASLSVGQEEVFNPEDVHIKLELLDRFGVATGAVIEGRLGDTLSFDSAMLLDGFVRATYTLYGALEQNTGFVLDAGLDLGLLAGEVHWTGTGPDFHESFGPLIPLPSPSFSTGLVTVVTHSKPVTLPSVTNTYAIYSEKFAVGTEASDILLIGPSQSGVTRGLGGDDIITGFGNNDDEIYGGTGNDTIKGSEHNDANSTADDEPGYIQQTDRISGETGNDHLFGGSGRDIIDGGEGSDELYGGGGDDDLYVFGIDGADTIVGGDGFDRAIINRSGTLEAWDIDLANFDSQDPTTFGSMQDLTIVTQVEAWNLTLGFGDDRIIGAAFDDVLDGGWGADELDGAGGMDRLYGSGGNDRLSYIYDYVVHADIENHRDEIYGGSGIDTVVITTNTNSDVAFNLSGDAGLGIAGTYKDSIIDAKQYYRPLLIGDVSTFLSAYDAHNSVPENVSLMVRADVERLEYRNFAAFGRDYVTGYAYDDLIDTGGGDDRLDGLMGRDLLDAGSGDDMVLSWDADEGLFGGSGHDVLWIKRLDTAPSVAVDLTKQSNSVEMVLSDGTRVSGFEVLIFNGNKEKDFARGGASADALYGFGGDDDLDGGGGGDLVRGGSGDDTVRSAERLGIGNQLDGESGNDTLYLDWSQVVGIVRHTGGGGDTSVPGGGGVIGTGPGEISFVPVALHIDLSAPGVQELGNGTHVSGFERLVVKGGGGNDVITGGNHEIVEMRSVTAVLPTVGIGEGGGIIDTGGGTPIRVLTEVRTGNIIDGGAGDDVIVGGTGRDILSGGEGNDRVTVNVSDRDMADGGDGFDTLVIDLRGSFYTALQFGQKFIDYSVVKIGGVVFYSDLVVTLPDGTELTNFERVEFIKNPVAEAANARLTGFADRWDGTSLADRIEGGGGADELIGRGGPDRLDGGDGDDYLEHLVVVPSPVPDPLGPIAELLGGPGDDLFSINDKAKLLGGDGFDSLLAGFGFLGVGVFGDFSDIGKGGKVSIFGGGDLFDFGGIESFDVSFGIGNDGGNFGLGEIALDFGGGFDVANVGLKGVGQDIQVGFSLGGFGAFAAFAAAGAPEDGGFAALDADPPQLVTSTGLALTNFEELKLVTGSGNDTIDLTGAPMLASVRIESGAGTDMLTGSTNADFLYAQAGTDQAWGGEGDDTIDGGAGSDALYGNDGRDRLLGGADADLLYGGDGDDTLDGGAGIDTMEGGAGNDTYIVDSLDDGVKEVEGEGSDTVKTVLAGYTLGLNLEILQLIGGGASTGVGNALDNSILGGAGDDTLSGLGGADRLVGGGGDDRLTGGAGRDVLEGGAGADSFVFAPGDFATLAKPDLIKDFDIASGDVIDLSAVPGLSFIGSAAFSGAAGQMRYQTVGGSTFVYIDLDGDAAPDAAIQLEGAKPLQGDDFLL